ncbi:Peptidase S8, subtilisin-related [Parasponia andersonii]|uniref:Peptidase S8, subtilisin-related n=1 Tax=Parasponia andersonii TaxID=3476 RepID=A0A2P5BD50_PARAD|nr:Peptidase S8, subtilisin-related [Parasponia andersonii]
MEKGIVVSTTAGNYGPCMGSMRNGIPWVLTVTAGTTDHWFAGILTLGNGLTITGWSTYPAEADNSEDYFINLPLVYNKTISPCSSIAMLVEASVQGIVVCDKGDVHIQITCILFSNLAGAILVYDKLDPYELKRMACPCIAVTSKDAAVLINYVETTNKPFASMKFQQTFTDKRPAPLVAAYASRGPSPTAPYVLKPDVMAPGSLVLGAWIPSTSAARRGPLKQPLYTNYTLDFGTSLACPHLAGVAALLKAAHPKWRAVAIRSAIMTTATPLDNTLNPIRDSNSPPSNASPLAMGSGHINPNGALDPGLIYDASPQDYIFANTRSVYYNCSSSPKNSYPDLNHPSFIALYDDDDDSKGLMVRKFRRTLTNVAATTAIDRVNITTPEDSMLSVWPEILDFEKKYDYERKEKGAVSFDDLVWVQQNGTHTIRSPIVISPLVALASPE